ncbi:MAG: membrane protein insertase YidC [Myxococcales bacterium]|nr:membrane protein insertase YidC [Myxococcales bacterium]
MPDRNLLLAFALSFAVLTLWSMYQSEPPPPRGYPAGTEVVEGSDRTAWGDGAGDPTAPGGSAARSRIPPVPGREARAVPGVAVTEPQAGQPIATEVEYEVDRNLYHARLSNIGASLTHWELNAYHDSFGEPIVLTTALEPNARSLATPFAELGLGDLSRVEFELEHRDSDTVVFRYEQDGIRVRKTYVFPTDGYEFLLRVEITNDSEVSIAPYFGVEWPAHVKEADDFKEQSFVVLQDGSVEMELVNGLGTPGFLGMSEPTNLVSYPGVVEWAGSATTYFLSVLLPDDPGRANALLIAEQPGKSGSMLVAFDEVSIPPGQSGIREYRGYIGPKEQERLVELGSNSLLAIDLGWSWVKPMTRFFNWMLQSLYQVVPNYGVAIILLTFLVRVVTAPLTTKQMRSMERMRALQPQLKEVQEKFGDDRQKQSEKTMELYRKEKVNPLGGCFPMLLQLPVFIGLFYALRSSISLRQAPFVSWINDLSVPETLFVIPGLELPIRVLPLVMGATMVVQQRMTPTPSMDPAQARMMTTVMPIMMTVLFYQFASGLVLYWMTSNVLAISHQRWIGRSLKK